jgi:hypothetical protein
MNESVAGRSERDELSPLRPRWEWSADEIKRIGRVVGMIAEHLTTLPEKPVFRPFPAELAAKYLDSKPPELGQEADDILATFARDIEPYRFGNAHPRSYGWVNSPPVALGIFAEALAAAMNPSCAGGNHAAIYVEHELINWFKQIIGFPPESMGLLVSGGLDCGVDGTRCRQAGAVRLRHPDPRSAGYFLN